MRGHVRPDGTGRTTLLSSYGSLAADSSNLYVAVADPGGKIVAIPLAGGSPWILATSSGNGLIATDGVNVYWTDSSGFTPIVKKVPVGGGSVTTLVAFTKFMGTLGPIAVDSTSVYVGASGLEKITPK